MSSLLDHIGTPEFLSFTLHLISAISIPIHCFGLYVILCKTPEQMSTVKWYLVSLHLWTVLFDYSISVFIMPIILFPEFAGYPLGWFKFVDQDYYVYAVVTTMIFMGCVLVSIISVFENQFHTICTFSQNSHWTYWRRFWLAGHYLTAISASVSFGLFVPEQEPARYKVLQKLPKLPSFISEASIFVFTEDGSYHLTMFLILVPFICIEVSIFVRSLIQTTSLLLTARKKSDKTYHLQKKFFIALVIQCCLPILTLIIPFSYSWVSILWRYYNQGLMNIAVITTTLHGLSSTVVMLIVHRPYREALLSLFLYRDGFHKGYGFRRKSLIVAVTVVFVCF